MATADQAEHGVPRPAPIHLGQSVTPREHQPPGGPRGHHRRDTGTPRHAIGDGPIPRTPRSPPRAARRPQLPNLDGFPNASRTPSPRRGRAIATSPDTAPEITVHPSEAETTTMLQSLYDDGPIDPCH